MPPLLGKALKNDILNDILNDDDAVKDVIIESWSVQ